MTSTRVLFFAKLREDLGCSFVDVDLLGPCSISQLRDHLISDNPEWNAIFHERQLLSSVNQTLNHMDELVHPGDEVAFFPPVTGG